MYHSIFLVFSVCMLEASLLCSTGPMSISAVALLFLTCDKWLSEFFIRSRDFYI